MCLELELTELFIGDIVCLPVVGLVWLQEVKPNKALDGSSAGLRYYFHDLVTHKFAVSIPDSGCYGPCQLFSTLQTLESFWRGGHDI